MNSQFHPWKNKCPHVSCHTHQNQLCHTCDSPKLMNCYTRSLRACHTCDAKSLRSLKVIYVKIANKIIILNLSLKKYFH